MSRGEANDGAANAGADASLDALRGALDLSDDEAAQLKGLGYGTLEALRGATMDGLTAAGVAPAFARRVVASVATLSEAPAPPPASLVRTLTNVTRWLHDENAELRQEVAAIKAVLAVQQQTHDADRCEWEAQIAALTERVEELQKRP